MGGNDVIVIISNILSGIGMALVMISSAFKSKKTIILLQTLNQVFAGIAFTMVGAYSGVAMSIACFIMNMFILFDKQNRKTNIVFLFLIIILGTLGILYENKDVLEGKASVDVLKIIFGLTPILANLEYALVTLPKNPRTLALRIGFFVSCVLWAMFDIYSKQYIAFGFNVASIVVNLVRSFTLRNQLKEEAKLYKEEHLAKNSNETNNSQDL